jgi:uncharacterized protein YcnI
MKSFPTPRALLPAAILLLAAAPAFAHVSAEPRQAPAGAYQAITFRVGHGCGKAATTALRIELPPGLASARPQPKPGWTLKIEKDGERPTAIVWSGDLPGDQFDEFAILTKLPDQAGPLYFPAIQSCGADEAAWTEVPDPDASTAALKSPAPSLMVTPAQGAPEHHH